MSREEAVATINERIEEHEEDSELYHVDWDDVYGTVHLMWNSPLIEDTYLEFDSPIDHESHDWDD